ncbi:zinc finger, CCHC-type containing protein [Tanacetum coccineum]
MTTTVVNNSLFRLLFEFFLTRNNLLEWYRNLTIVLSTEDKLPFLEQPIPVLPVPPQGQANPPNVITTHQAWVKAQKEITGLMLMTMDPEIQKTLQIKSIFKPCENSMRANKKKGTILVSLRKEYRGFANYNMHSIGKNQKKKSHKAAKGNHRKGKAKMGYAPVQAPPFAPKSKNPPTPKKDNPTKDAVCHQCGEAGHWRRNCPIYLSELMKKKKLSQGASISGIFTIELHSFSSTSWVYDTGCGTYICITTQGLRGSRKLKPRALILYVGDGHRTTVNAIGDFHLCLPSGLVLILHNCHYAPSITRVIILVSVCTRRDHGIIAHRTPPYTPQYNGVSERRNRTLLDMVRSMMSQTTLPKSFWDYALESAARILNIVPTKKALVKRDTLTKPDKLEPRAFRCIFVGYPKETNGYSFYYPPENKIFVARNAEFFENDVIDHEASGSLEDLEIIQEEDTHPSLDTSLDHEEDDQEIDEP